jgi:hypothetical protein
LPNIIRVQLIWVPGHKGTDGNEIADQLAKLGSEHPFEGPELAWSISVGVAKKVIRDWKIIVHRKRRYFHLSGFQQEKQLIQGSSAKKTRELLNFKTDQLQWVVGLFAGHFHLKGHLFKLGLVNSPGCERCLEKKKNQPHISHVIVR